MSSSDLRKRTAVLVVHGMGSQRPLDTVRGVIDAVWCESDDRATDRRKFWVHPERSGADVDLSVFTTNAVSEQNKRSVDFHELYWAHLMSETRPVAVLLWLFELARKGPRLNPRMVAVWWGGAIFLALLILSVSFLAILGVQKFAAVADEPQSMLYAPLLMLLIVVAASLLFSLYKGALRFAVWAAVALATLAILLVLMNTGFTDTEIAGLTNNVLPLAVALVATLVVMGGWGVPALALASVLSLAFFALHVGILGETFSHAILLGYLPWTLTSEWSAVAACLIIATYLALNAAFLQSFLGDAARYFRDSPANVAGRREIRKQAVDTLDELHACGNYDRIIVVAHSLGTVIAYDMLRVYYGRICGRLPDPHGLEPEVKQVDEGTLDSQALRRNGREVIRKIAAIADAQAQAQAADCIAPANKAQPAKTTSWLVTDFVTLGSPLVHAHYLMCRGNTAAKLAEDFKRRVREREFPVCRPEKIDRDGLLTFHNPRMQTRQFHHGGPFGLTRWTNLFFPMRQLIWGDAVGGPLADVFGNDVLDVEVCTRTPGVADLFTHVKYWDVECKPGLRKAPHIEALREAIKLDEP